MPTSIQLICAPSYFSGVRPMTTSIVHPVCRATLSLPLCLSYHDSSKSKHQAGLLLVEFHDLTTQMLSPTTSHIQQPPHANTAWHPRNSGSHSLTQPRLHTHIQSCSSDVGYCNVDALLSLLLAEPPALGGRIGLDIGHRPHRQSASSVQILQLAYEAASGALVISVLQPQGQLAKTLQVLG